MVFVVKVFVVGAEEVLLSSPSLQPHSQEQGLQRVFGLGTLRGLVSSLWPLHPADLVLDPFPETRPLAELGTAASRGGQRDHLVLLRSMVAIFLHEISPAA